jgi:uncharacterized protein
MAGVINHVEFPADDVERAKRFYSAVAGWDYQEMEGYGGYWLFSTGDGTGGAIGTRGTAAPEKLRVYITIDSVEAGLAAALANGGTQVDEIQDVPGQGRFATVRDPEGNEVSLWEQAPAG